MSGTFRHSRKLRGKFGGARAQYNLLRFSFVRGTNYSHFIQNRLYRRSIVATEAWCPENTRPDGMAMQTRKLVSWLEVALCCWAPGHSAKICANPQVYLNFFGFHRNVIECSSGISLLFLCITSTDLSLNVHQCPSTSFQIALKYSQIPPGQHSTTS